MSHVLRKRCFAIGCLVLGMAEALVPDASADTPNSAAKTATPRAGDRGLAATHLAEALRSSDAEQVRQALGEIKRTGSRGAALAPAIADLLRRGTTPELAGLALVTLASVATPAETSAIVPYTHHRIVDLRNKAVTALGTSGGEKAVAAVRAALGDPEARVRASAANGLGALHAHDALPDLYKALDHDVLEAASAIGQVCNHDECTVFAEKTGKLGLDVMISGFDAILFRPSTQVGDPQKIAIIERVRDLRTQEANKYLRDVQSRLPAGSARVREALEQAISATAGATS